MNADIDTNLKVFLKKIRKIVLIFNQMFEIFSLQVFFQFTERQINRP